MDELLKVFGSSIDCSELPDEYKEPEEPEELKNLKPFSEELDKNSEEYKQLYDNYFYDNISISFCLMTNIDIDNICKSIVEFQNIPIKVKIKDEYKILGCESVARLTQPKSSYDCKGLTSYFHFYKETGETIQQTIHKLFYSSRGIIKIFITGPMKYSGIQIANMVKQLLEEDKHTLIMDNLIICTSNTFTTEAQKEIKESNSPFPFFKLHTGPLVEIVDEEEEG